MLVIGASLVAGGLVAGSLLPVVRRTAPYGGPAPKLGRWQARGVVVGASAAAALGVVAAPPSWTLRVALGVFMSVGFVLAVIDVRTMRLPDVLTVPLTIVVGSLVTLEAVLSADWGAWRTAMWCAVALTVVLGGVFLAWPGGMGLGDVKIAPVVGLVGGLYGAGPCAAGLFLAVSAAAVIGLVSAARTLGTGKSAFGLRIAFGPFLIAGASLAALVGAPVWDWYATIAGLA